jgi:Flp pilus assembly protein TadG
MTIQALLKRLQAFRSDTSGNLAIIFGLTLVPLFGLVGLAVDYNRVAGVRTSMQAAVDSTALMLSKEASNLSAEALKTKATQYFTANFKRPEGKSLVVVPTLTIPSAGSWSLNVKATGKVDTMFMRYVGFTGSGVTAPSQLDVAASSQVNWGMKKLELALALDNTGSMASSSKMTELKKAVKNLLTTLKAAEKQSGDIKVALIPFDTSVKIGTGYKDKDWFDTESLDCGGWASVLGSLLGSWGSGSGWGSGWGSGGQGAGCNKNNWKSHWDGCVRDRTHPNDGLDTLPSASDKKTLFPVFDCGSLAQMLPLTSDWTALTSRVDDMAPNGMTNVTIGLAWGWHALTGQDPLAEAAPAKSDLDKVIILLTDGENTEGWNNENNQKITSVTALDDRTRKACANVRAAGIKVYAVRVIDGNKDLLRDCATNPGMFYDVQQASDLNAVFTAIANSLANLYIAK